jgi:hypothetical protein
MGVRVRGKATARPISVEGPTFERVSRVGRGGNRGSHRDEINPHIACQIAAGGRAPAAVARNLGRKRHFAWATAAISPQRRPLGARRISQRCAAFRNACAAVRHRPGRETMRKTRADLTFAGCLR